MDSNDHQLLTTDDIDGHGKTLRVVDCREEDKMV